MYKLMLGNCLDKLKEIDENSIDLVVTSPPYDDLRKYKGYSFDFENIAKELYRVIKQGGTMVWVVGDATKDGDETGTSFRQALYFKEIGFKLLDTMIYEKNGCGACGSNKCYIQNFEYMFVLTKGDINTFNLIYDRENKVTGMTKGNVSRHIYTVDVGKKTREYEAVKWGRRYNIWKYNQAIGGDEFSRQHPASFPEQLAEDHILSWSNEGDTVLDPFLGSGTTGKMSLLNKRNFIGIEISEDYLKIAQERIKTVENINIDTDKYKLYKDLMKYVLKEDFNLEKYINVNGIDNCTMVSYMYKLAQYDCDSIKKYDMFCDFISNDYCFNYAEVINNILNENSEYTEDDQIKFNI